MGSLGAFFFPTRSRQLQSSMSVSGDLLLLRMKVLCARNRREIAVPREFGSSEALLMVEKPTVRLIGKHRMPAHT